jgi:hypothetical protein
MRGRGGDWGVGGWTRIVFAAILEELETTFGRLDCAIPLDLCRGGEWTGPHDQHCIATELHNIAFVLPNHISQEQREEVADGREGGREI